MIIQKGFWQDEFIGATRQKLEELYFNNPQAFKSEKRCMLEYWSTYENLREILGYKWEDFNTWFMKTTSPETITRCRRAMKEDGTIKLSPRESENGKEQELLWRDYWRNNKQNREVEIGQSY